MGDTLRLIFVVFSFICGFVERIRRFFFLKGVLFVFEFAIVGIDALVCWFFRFEEGDLAGSG